MDELEGREVVGGKQVDRRTYVVISTLAMGRTINYYVNVVSESGLSYLWMGV